MSLQDFLNTILGEMKFDFMFPKIFIFKNHESVFVQRRNLGLVRYEPKLHQRGTTRAFVKPLFYRRITPLHVHTHFVK